MNRLQEMLQKKKILVSDGAWGTMLQSQGLMPGDCPEEWNISHPDNVRAIAAQYIGAGSDIVLTNTFGGSRFKLSSYNYQDQVYEINRAGASISRQAAGENVIVLSSVGPTGKFLEPLGDVTEQEMIDNFYDQMRGLVDGGVDGILIETMADTAEAVCAVKAAKAVCKLPVLVTFTFERGKMGYRTMMGVTIPRAVEALTAAGVDMIGTNCGNGIEQVVEIIAEMRRHTDKYLVAHPNAGLPKLVQGTTIFDQSPDEMATYVRRLIDAGANIIGGCCGTTPAHIAAIAKIIHS
ncbi:MAG: homocysteine S-methyltransferase family protein [Candidatus Zhuqueibacterota bacterium]